MQQGDVFLFQTNDDGDINLENGLIEMSGGLGTSVYLSLFGGNEDDDGRGDNPFNWWGNIGELQDAHRYRSETQNILQSVPSTSANLLRVEDAAKRDLSWLLENNICSSVSVSAAIPRLNKIQLNITIEALGEESDFEFTENWKASS
jgi:phage gp46-like protein